MRRKRFTEEQIIAVLQEAPTMPIRELCRKHGIAETTFHRWRTRIKKLQENVPSLRVELGELADKLVDMHPLIKDFVYHPDFGGSFSLKDVLTPLVPEMSYKDTIAINNGQLASVEIARLLFMAGKIPPEEHERVRADLLAYCKQDTWAMVRLLEKVRALAVGA